MKVSNFAEHMIVPPVLFLVFNRPDTTARVFEAIRRIKPRQFFVAADGPRAGVEGDERKCQVAREIITQVDWDCEVRTLFRDENLGCKLAVSSAIDWFFNQVEEGIILEDDCLPSDSFFSFCAELLDRYRDDEQIMMISGNNFQNGIQRGEASYYFSQIPHIWGWATWRRAWKKYDGDMRLFPDFVRSGAIRKVSEDVDVQNYWLSCLIPTYEGKIKTWDYQWVFSMFTSSGLSICPQTNLVSNIGFGEGATNTSDVNPSCANLDRYEIGDISHPMEVATDFIADLHEYRKVLNVKCHRIKTPVFRLRKQLRKRWKARRSLAQFKLRHCFQEVAE